MGATEYIPVSQVEQGDASEAPPEIPTTPITPEAAVEDALAQLKVQIRWSSMWVNYMLAVQVLASFWFPSNLLFFVNLFFNIFGLVGVLRQRRDLISVHFGYTIGLHCVAWFIVIYTMFYATFVSLIALAFCLVQSIGLRHERNLLSLLNVVPAALEQIAVEQQKQQEQESQQETETQPEQPQVQLMPAMPTFSYGVYGQQVPSSGMEQPMYPGMFPGFYPLPQGYFNMPQQQMPGYPFPPQGFAFAPFPIPPQSVDIPVSEENKQ